MKSSGQFYNFTMTTQWTTYLFRFANGGDEMAMNAEIGLYLDFKEIDGIPNGCPGLGKFTLKKYLKSNFLSNIDEIVFPYHFN